MLRHANDGIDPRLNGLLNYARKDCGEVHAERHTVERLL